MFKLKPFCIVAFTALVSTNSIAASFFPSDLEKFKNTNICINCDLSEVDLSWSQHNNANLSHALLIKADFHLAKLAQSNFSHAQIMYADFSSVNASGSDFSGADLSDTKMNAGNFSNANFSGAVLDGADLAYAILARAQITETQLATAKSLHCAILPNGKRFQGDNEKC